MITKMQLTVFGIAALLGTVDTIVTSLPAAAIFCKGALKMRCVGDIANNTGQPVTNDTGKDIIEAPTEPDDINPGNTIE